MDFITNFFVPKKFFSNLSKTEKLQLLTRIRLVAFTHSLTAITFFIIFSIELRYINDDNFTIFALPITAVILFFGLFYIKITGNPKLSYWLTIILVFTVTPLRAYYGGGAGAGILSWYFATLAIISALHTRRTVYICATIGVIQIALLHLIPLPDYTVNIDTELYACVLAYITCAGTLRMRNKVNEELTEEAKRLERTETLNILITTLSHEINNPLTIAVGNTKGLKKEDPEDERYTKINDSLARITKIVKTISTIKDYSKDDLAEYTKNSKILDIQKSLK